MRALQVGDTVKLTGKFLKNTGQRVGGEGQKSWVIVSCDCAMCKGDYCAVDEASQFGGQRHFLKANLYRKGTLAVHD